MTHPDAFSDDVPNDVLLPDLFDTDAPDIAELIAVDTIIAHHAARTTFERLLVIYTGWLTRCATTLASHDATVAADLIHAGTDTLWELCRGAGPPSSAVVYCAIYRRLVSTLRTLRRAGVARSTWGRRHTRLPYQPSSLARTPTRGPRSASSLARDPSTVEGRGITVERDHA